MSYRSERFNRRMKSLEDMVAGFSDVSKARAFSDRDAGVRRMLAALDYDPLREDLAEDAAKRLRDERLFEAEMRLADAGKSYLIRVLLLIVENGSNREESIRRTSKRTYFRHRDALLRFFSQPQPWVSTSRSGTRAHTEI